MLSRGSPIGPAPWSRIEVESASVMTGATGAEEVGLKLLGGDRLLEDIFGLGSTRG